MRLSQIARTALALAAPMAPLHGDNLKLGDSRPAHKPQKKPVRHSHFFRTRSGSMLATRLPGPSPATNPTPSHSSSQGRSGRPSR